MQEFQNRTLYRLSFILLLLFTCARLTAQSPVNVAYDIESDFGADVSWKIYKDSRGLIWAGPAGQGAAAFNGSKFFKLTEDDGLLGNLVIAFLEDHSGKMWFSCQGAGISVWDGRRFTNYSVTDSVGLYTNNYLSIFESKDREIYLGSFGYGLLKMKDGRFETFLDSNATIYEMLQDDEGVIWLASRNKGLGRLDGDQLTWIDKEAGLTNSLMLNITFDENQNIICATSAGLFRYDKVENEVYDYSELEYFPSDKAVGSVLRHTSGNLIVAMDNALYALTSDELIKLNGHGRSGSNPTGIVEDQAGNIWMSTNGVGLLKMTFNGIETISLPNRNSITLATETDEGEIYLSGTAGIFKLKGSESQELMSFDQHDINTLTVLLVKDSMNIIGVSADDGVYQFNPMKNEAVLLSSVLGYDAELEGDSALVWVGVDGVNRIDFNRRTVKKYAPLGVEKPYVSIVGVGDGGMYIGSYTDGDIVYMDHTDTIAYTTENGLQTLAKVDLKLDSKGRLWYLDIDGSFGRKEGDQFVNYPPCIMGASETFEFDANDDIWMSGQYGILYIDLENDKLVGTQVYNNAVGVHEETSKMGQAHRISNNRILIPKTASDAYLITPENTSELTEKPVVYIENIMGKDYTELDSAWYSSYGSLYGIPDQITLPYDNNNLSFEVGAIYFSAPDSIAYSYLLSGYSDEWSLPQSSSLISFTNLPAGEYQLELKAITPSGESDVVTYEFVVSTPWFQTWWFYLLIIGGGIGIIYLFVRMRLKKLEKDKIRLEKEVADRTREVVNEKEKVTNAYLHLEEKNQEILDSITYAKRIQQAILPPEKLVEKNLKQNFILYLPKDIVAGDFYWLEECNNGVLFAAADCTGHGVPGAMVSVICNNGLNRSVREYGLTDPGKILDSTREIVVAEFEKSEEEVKDGMDIALCKLIGNQLSYAGANNPLWIIRKGSDEIEEIKANKQPIGKFDGARPFDTHTIELNEGDTFYIFSDGYADQFGGDKGKKFKAANLKRLLIAVQENDMKQQRAKVTEAFQSWKGELEQLDDVCLIGVRFTTK